MHSNQKNKSYETETRSADKITLTWNHKQKTPQANKALQ